MYMSFQLFSHELDVLRIIHSGKKIGGWQNIKGVDSTKGVNEFPTMSPQTQSDACKIYVK